MVSKNLDATSFFIKLSLGIHKSTPQLQNPKNMSSILLIILIIISLTVAFCNSAFQSRSINFEHVKRLFTKKLSDFKQLMLKESDKFFCKIKISRNTFIQKQPFPQR